jgi:hypothetical protein
METEYSLSVHRELEQEFLNTRLYRPMTIERFEPGTELEYDITGVIAGNRAKVHLAIEKFIGGGFAGQVYQVRVIAIDGEQGPIEGIETGKILAMKILIPPSLFSRLFRNMLYWIGFQGPFQLQVNPAAARCGAIWQKFIRRAAKLWFGSEMAVVDIYATFTDDRMGSCGELSEWIEGRTWRLEVNDHLDLLKHWKRGKKIDEKSLGSPEYRTKHEFMHKFVDLLHAMGAYEFARQYEWSTCKSQPNCLKRKETEGSPTEGLVSVDFRAGLVLLPFLPMSPGDIKLIFKGLMRGTLVQFDRGDISRLEQFIAANAADFSDMEKMLEDLKKLEKEYRNSLIDITHHHFRLLYSGKLWSTIVKNLITGWKVRKLIDDQCERNLRRSKIKTLHFALLGIIPIIGRFIRRIWGQPSYRKHYRQMLTGWTYLKRAIRGKLIEKIISWHRSGRVDDLHAQKLKQKIWRCLFHLPMSFFPVGLHRFITDLQYMKERLVYYILRPVRLYFNAVLRAQWLHDMVTEGKKKHILSDEDAAIILSQVKEPFIQKYLKSLAVHVCTLPVTQIVSVTLAIIYLVMHPEVPRAQAYAIAVSILALFQVVPISPGSLVRGLYVVYLVIKERNFKDYNIAVFLGFFKYIGYLAFPIQMTYRYPALARFMAAHWATDAVHIVPVFGERGALLEHFVFSLFYNLPLTIRRRMRERSELRAKLKSRYWPIVIYTLLGTGTFLFINNAFTKNFNTLPLLEDIWPLAIIIPFLCGAAVTIAAGGASLAGRIIGGAICGSLTGLFYTIISAFLLPAASTGMVDIIITAVWFIFIFTTISTIGVLLTEIKLPGKKIDS